MTLKLIYKEVINMFEKLREDSVNLWVGVCETNYPSFWGFLLGYCGTATVIYTVVCFILIIFGKKVKAEES